MRSGIQDAAAAARRAPHAPRHGVDSGNDLLAPNVCVCVCVCASCRFVPALGDRLPTVRGFFSMFRTFQTLQIHFLKLAGLQITIGQQENVVAHLLWRVLLQLRAHLSAGAKL